MIITAKGGTMKRKLVFVIIGISLAILTGALAMKNHIKAFFYIDHMERRERTARMNVERVVDSLQIAEGDIIADLGAGSGLFTRLFAQKAGDAGHVYAVDLNMELLRHIEQDACKKNMPNITTVRALEHDPRIPAQVDLIFICDTLHYIEEQERYVRTASSYLKPGGRFAIIDFTRNWPPMSIRFTADDLTAWMERAGLAREADYNFVEDEFFLVFRKRASQ